MKRFGSAALLAAALGACSGGGGNAQANAAVEGNAQTSAAASAPALGPLTAQEICTRLTAQAVGEIIGHESVTAAPSDSATPQCSYTYPDGPGSANITVAYMRPDGDLGGRTGEDGYDYVLRLNRSAEAQEQVVQAGQRAVRLSGSNVQMGVVLTSGRVLTVIVLPSFRGGTVDRLIQAAGEAFAR